MILLDIRVDPSGGFVCLFRFRRSFSPSSCAQRWRTSCRLTSSATPEGFLVDVRLSRSFVFPLCLRLSSSAMNSSEAFARRAELSGLRRVAANRRHTNAVCGMRPNRSGEAFPTPSIVGVPVEEYL